MSKGGASVEWTLRKGDYSGTSAVTLDLEQTRVQQQMAKESEKEPYPNDPETIDHTDKYPFMFVFDTGKSMESFKIEGTFTDENDGSAYAFDKKHKLRDMYRSCRTGSLHLVQFSAASGTNTGSEDYVVTFDDLTFIHQSPGVNRVDYAATFTVGSEFV